MYYEKINKIKKSIENIKVFETEEVKKMLDIAKELTKTSLDRLPPHRLLEYGSTLAGLYASFSTKHFLTSSEYEIANSAYKQAYQLTQLGYLDEKYKVTEARNKTDLKLVDENDDVLTKKLAEQQWDTVVDTTKTLLMFVQSALSQKKSEMFINRDLYNSQD